MATFLATLKQLGYLERLGFTVVNVGSRKIGAGNRDQQSPERLFRLACIADAMQFSDYALEILEYITLNYGRENPQYNFADVIVQVLAQAAKPMGRSLESLSIVASLRDFITRSELLKPDQG